MVRSTMNSNEISHSWSGVGRVRALRNVRNYELQYALVGVGGALGDWKKITGLTDSRSMPINGLTPGMTYAVQVRALGGSTGTSDWSDPVSHMCA